MTPQEIKDWLGTWSYSTQDAPDQARLDGGVDAMVCIVREDGEYRLVKKETIEKFEQVSTA